MTVSVAADPSGYALPDAQRRVLRWTIYIGYAALVAGVFHGLANALSYARIDIIGWFPARTASCRCSPAARSGGRCRRRCSGRRSGSSSSAT